MESYHKITAIATNTGQKIAGVRNWNRKSDEIEIWVIIYENYVKPIGFLKKRYVRNYSGAVVILEEAPMRNMNPEN